MGQRHQRVQRVEIALHLSEIGFKRPERGDKPRRNAIVRLHPAENTGIFPDSGLAVFHPAVGNQRFGELKERLAKHPLRPVGFQHLGILARRGKKGVNRRRRVAGTDRLGLDPLQPAAKIAATGHLCRRRAGHQPHPRPTKIARIRPSTISVRLDQPRPNRKRPSKSGTGHGFLIGPNIPFCRAVTEPPAQDLRPTAAPRSATWH